MRLALFDLDHTLIPLDSDHAWGQFTVAQGWRDAEAFGRAASLMTGERRYTSLVPTQLWRLLAQGFDPARTRLRELLLGGAATVFGPLVGSLIFWVLQAFLTNILPALAESGILPVSGIQAATLRYVLVGIGLMLIVIYRPQGIFGDKREMTFVK